MTEAQEQKIYWPFWNRAKRANAWYNEDTRLQNADPDRCPAKVRDSDIRREVLTAAHILANEQHTAINIDHVRRAVHWIAIAKKDCSHKDIPTKKFGRVMALLKLLIDPDDLGAMNEWLHPELDEKRQIIAVIKRAPEAYIRKIAGDRWGVVHWEDHLKLEELKQLAATIATRQNRRGREFTHHE